jgi:hypothetical protein
MTVQVMVHVKITNACATMVLFIPIAASSTVPITALGTESVTMVIASALLALQVMAAKNYDVQKIAHIMDCVSMGGASVTKTGLELTVR